MKDINEVRIEGRLGGFPKVHEYKGRTTISFSIATNDELVDEAGFATEVTNWNRVTASGDLANELLDQLAVGTKVLVTGRVVTRDWKDANGQRRYITEIRAVAVDVIAQSRKVHADTGAPLYPDAAARVAAARATPPPIPRPPASPQDWAQRSTMADDDLPF